MEFSITSVPVSNPRLYLFVCISLPQRSSLTSTLRRLGEDLYHGRVAALSKKSIASNAVGQTTSPRLEQMKSIPEKSKETIFLRSDSQEVRFLSGLLILKSLTQGIYHLYNINAVSCERVYLISNSLKSSSLALM